MSTQTATVRSRPGITLIVPVYNSEDSLSQLIEEIGAALGDEIRNQRLEIILIDDGSVDHSWRLVQELAHRHSHVHGYSLARNYGQHNALLCGIRNARFDTIVTLDDDLQHPPSEIRKLLAKLDEGHDVVYGAPEKTAHGVFRTFASWMTKAVLKRAMGAESAQNVSAFRAFRSQVQAAFGEYRGPLVSLDVMLTWGTSRFTYVRVRHDRRAFGASNYSFRRLVAHAMTMMTGFSTLPLRFATWLGFSTLIFGLCILGYVLGRYLLFGTTVPGFTFIASAVTIFSGVILFCLGVMGEYIARMHVQLFGRPPYVVRERANREGQRDTAPR